MDQGCGHGAGQGAASCVRVRPAARRRSAACWPASPPAPAARPPPHPTAQAAFGRNALAVSSLLSYVGLGLGLLGSSLALPFGLYVLICQRTAGACLLPGSAWLWRGSSAWAPGQLWGPADGRAAAAPLLCRPAGGPGSRAPPPTPPTSHPPPSHPTNRRAIHSRRGQRRGRAAPRRGCSPHHFCGAHAGAAGAGCDGDDVSGLARQLHLSPG